MINILILLLTTTTVTSSSSFSTTTTTTTTSSVIYGCNYFQSHQCEDDKGTNNGLMNYGSCYFSACGGQDVVISNYKNCTGDTILRLYDKNGYELSYHDDVYWVRLN